MSDVLSYLVALLLWPGLAGGALLGWLFLWLQRKLTARMQRRFGPPFYQPFYDFFKLLGKQTVIPRGVNPLLFYGLPTASLAAMLCVLALMPVPGNPVHSFAGDLIVLIYLLEVPALCDVLAGFSSRSLYGQVSAARETLLSLGYNLPFLAALIALALQVGSFQLDDLVNAPLSLVHVLAAAAFLLAVPARLKSNPFSIANAEQEILAGVHTEYNGAPLALFELTHGLELVALAGLFTLVIMPALSSGLAELAIYLLISTASVIALSVLAAGTARIKVQQAMRFYWRWGLVAALIALVAAWL
jgi:NADH-quinone oxidoreductase subunit H